MNGVYNMCNDAHKIFTAYVSYNSFWEYVVLHVFIDACQKFAE